MMNTECPITRYLQLLLGLIGSRSESSDRAKLLVPMDPQAVHVTGRICSCHLQLLPTAKIPGVSWARLPCGQELKTSCTSLSLEPHRDRYVGSGRNKTKSEVIPKTITNLLTPPRYKAEEDPQMYIVRKGLFLSPDSKLRRKPNRAIRRILAEILFPPAKK